jgi:hypothetical protein
VEPGDQLFRPVGIDDQVVFFFAAQGSNDVELFAGGQFVEFADRNLATLPQQFQVTDPAFGRKIYFCHDISSKSINIAEGAIL